MSDFKVIHIVEKQPRPTETTIREIEAVLPTVIAAQQAFAQVTRARFVALTTEGFTPEQALVLCK